jgi:predicted RNA methylase
MKRYLHLHTSLLPENLEKNRKNFIPEIEPTLLKYDKSFWEKIFPVKKNTKISDYTLSNIGSYSILHPKDGEKLAEIIKSFLPGKCTITDANANMGGATLAFTNYFDHVNSVEILPFHCKILENNIKVYDVTDKVSVHCMDYLDIGDKLEQDAIFFDPPWGGPDYTKKQFMDMYLDNISISNIVKSLISKNKIKLVAIRVPFNYDFKKILEQCDESHVFTFKKSDGRLNFFLIILKIN